MRVYNLDVWAEMLDEERERATRILAADEWTADYATVEDAVSEAMGEAIDGGAEWPSGLRDLDPEADEDEARKWIRRHLAQRGRRYLKQEKRRRNRNGPTAEANDARAGRRNSPGRRHRVRHRDLVDRTADTAEAALGRGGHEREAGVLRAAMALLPADEAEALKLRANHVPYAKIGEKLGISKKQAERTYKRAAEKMRDLKVLREWAKAEGLPYA